MLARQAETPSQTNRHHKIRIRGKGRSCPFYGGGNWKLPRARHRPKRTFNVGRPARNLVALQKTSTLVGHWWLMPVILATQEAEIRRIRV
jgi:hypothetical protein